MITKFVMVDIETLNSDAANPCIIQVGTTYARKEPSGWAFRTASCFCRPNPSNISIKTLAWWATQSNFAQIINGAVASTYAPVDAFQACLCEVLNTKDGALAPDDVYLVANPPSFDIAMLRACYRLQKFPFHWSKELDYRTSKNLHGDRRKEAAEQMADLGEGGQAHDAEYDALLQARAFTLILDDIG